MKVSFLIHILNFSLQPLAFSDNPLYNLSMNQSSILYRLQQIDSQLDQVKNRLLEVEVAINDNSLIIHAQQKLSEAEDNFSSELKKLHKAEDAVQDTRIKIEQTESTLYGGKVHNPKELQDLQNESSALKRRIAELEDHQLEVMMSTEEAEAKSKLAANALNEIQNNINEQNVQYIVEKTILLSQIERLDAERQAAIGPIPPNDLDLYEQLRKARKGVAVVKISGKTCTACGTTLSPAMVQSTQSSGSLVRCPTCGRILYPG
jgi:predicted  nucleic acid-binding Zn-ribbon protein